MKKPPYISHYLVLRDLLQGIDVRQYSDTIRYLCSRIENIKLDLTKEGIKFIEDVTRESSYARYKPYILVPTAENLNRAKRLLESYATDEVLSFLESKPYIANGNDSRINYDESGDSL